MSAESAHLFTFGAETETEIRSTSTVYTIHVYSWRDVTVSAIIFVQWSVAETCLCTERVKHCIICPSYWKVLDLV